MEHTGPAAVAGISRRSCQADVQPRREARSRQRPGLAFPVSNLYLYSHSDMQTSAKTSVRSNEASDDTCSIRLVDVDRVDATRGRALDRDSAVRVADLFRLLGDPGRVQILRALLEAGELCVCDLAAVVEMAESTVSHSLRLLRTAGIVRNRRSGRQVFYSLDDAHVRLLLDVSVEHVLHGTDS